MEPHSAIAALFHHPGGDETTDALSYLGSAFAYKTPTHFLTAAHCASVLPAEPEQILLFPRTQVSKQPQAVLKAKSVVSHPTADLSVLEVHEFSLERQEGLDVFLGVEPFDALALDQIVVGRTVAVFGYPMAPQDEFRLDSREIPTERILMGWAQRHYDFVRHPYRYPAAEISVPFPRGISGAPVFVPEPPFGLIGIATDNADISPRIDSREVVEEGGQKFVVERYRTISYGTALRLAPFVDWVDEQIAAAAASDADSI